MTTPEILSALEANAPGSLIPTVQLRALVEAVENVRRLAAALEGQAKFADHDIAAHQRDTARRIRGAIAASPNPPVGGNESNGSSRDHDPGAGSALDALGLAVLFHVTYERLAAKFNYVTRTETRIFDPMSDNGRLMVAVCAEILADLSRAKQTPDESSRDEPKPPSGSAHTITSAEVARLVEELNAHAEFLERDGDGHQMHHAAEAIRETVFALESLALSEGRMREALKHFDCGCEGACERKAHPDMQDDACFARQALQGGKG